MFTMLNSVLKDAIQKREETLSILKGPIYEKIIQIARENWVEFMPKKEQSEIAGVDSSFNSKKFQGAELWAVTAVSVKSDGEILSDLHDNGLGLPSSNLETMASDLEIQACIESVDKVDLVLMDGSIHTHFLKEKASLESKIINVISKNNNVVFVSKTSSSRAQFERMNSIAGDIFYYNHATNSAGFSKIFRETKYGPRKIITSVFARLSESLPLIKIEILGSNHTDDEMKSLLGKLYKTSIGGYPYALKLAHNNCKISGNDMSKLISLHHLSNEIGSREVLE